MYYGVRLFTTSSRSFCQPLKDISVTPSEKFSSLDLTDRGRLIKISGISAVSNLPLNIAERQRNRGWNLLREKGIAADMEIINAPSIGKGTFFFILVEFENAIAGFSSLGAIGKKAEKVAEEACQDFFQYLDSGAAIDEHLADQIIPYIALTKGTSIFTVSKVSQHLLTNIWAVKQFLPVDINVEGELGDKGEIKILFNSPKT
ncbi:MAG: hypothetical protein HY097_03005 [Nitrospinae bacterium]|nr:hypothetical protein [Nitrospinota bacterium]